MTALSLGYRKRAKWVMVGIGMVLAVVVNVDAVIATEKLWRDDALRAALVAEGERVTDKCASSDDRTKCLQDEADKVGDAVTLPIGWQEADLGWSSALGWFIAGLAIAQGAPFWFDILQRATRLRRGQDPAGAAS